MTCCAMHRLLHLSDLAGMSCSEVGFETATAPPPPVNDGERLKRAKVIAQTEFHICAACPAT